MQIGRHGNILTDTGGLIDEYITSPLLYARCINQSWVAVHLHQRSRAWGGLSYLTGYDASQRCDTSMRSESIRQLYEAE